MKIFCLKLLNCLICTFFLLIPSVLLGQYGGGHGHHNDGGIAAPSGPTADTKNNDIKGFERTVALQATPEQIAQFQRLSASTRDARRRTQELLLQLSSGKAVGNADPLANAVEEAQADDERFLQSFSKEQEEGLKKITKKMRKADSEVSRQNKALSLGFEQGNPEKWVSTALEKLDKALGDSQSEQLAIAAEMGIQAKGDSGQPESQPVGALQR